MTGTRPNLNPVVSFGQMDFSRPSSSFNNRCNKQAVAEHVSSLSPQTGLVGKTEGQRAHGRQAGLGILVEGPVEIGAQPFADGQKMREDLEEVLGIRPDLVVPSCICEDVEKLAAIIDLAIGGGKGHVIGHPHTMQAAYRGEHPELEPAHEQFVEIWIRAMALRASLGSSSQGDKVS